MKRVIYSAISRKRQPIEASVSWDYFKKFNIINDQYLPDSGEGATMATQICTAVSKLVYKWYNDGDVFDNTYGMEGWANDLSSYANWLYKYVPASKEILSDIADIFSENEYEDLLRNLCDTLLDAEDMENYDKQSKQGSIYDCSGPFKFEEYYEDEEDEEDDYYDDDYDDEDY